jgi:hypothetical protein
LIDFQAYTGDMYAEKKHGKGVLTWPDGRMYTGDFFADKRHGFGIFQTSDISEFKVFLIIKIKQSFNYLFSRVYIVKMNDLVQVYYSINPPKVLMLVYG